MSINLLKIAFNLSYLQNKTRLDLGITPVKAGFKFLIWCKTIRQLQLALLPVTTVSHLA
jgi:hypothetical protein